MYKTDKFGGNNVLKKDTLSLSVSLSLSLTSEDIASKAIFLVSVKYDLIFSHVNNIQFLTNFHV